MSGRLTQGAAERRALVVDDSKSARAFLAKLLEERQLAVDAAETAEQAIDYLAKNRPDVIFMDHLMPGMDGFQAVQLIKGNPDTAQIPVLMYTSQEGELYLGQAQALGAAGVLAKGAGAAALSEVLQQLQITPATELPPPFQVGDAPDLDGGPAAAAAPPPDPLHLLREELAAWRAQLAQESQTQAAQAQVQIDTFRAELLGLESTREAVARDRARSVQAGMRDELRAVLREDFGRLLRESMPPLPVPRPSPLPWVLAVTASVAAAVLGTLWWQQLG